MTFGIPYNPNHPIILWFKTTGVNVETRKENTFQSEAECALRSSWSVLEHWIGPSSAGRRVWFCLIDDLKEGSVWAWAKLMSWRRGKLQRNNSLLFLQDTAHYSSLNLFFCAEDGGRHSGPSKSWKFFNPLALYNKKAGPWNCWSEQMFSVCTGFQRYHNICCCWAVLPSATQLPGIQWIVLWKGQHFLVLLVCCLQEITSNKSFHAACKAKNYSGEHKA